VLIHGGYPYTLDMIWLTAAKNVLHRLLVMGYYVYPSELKTSSNSGFRCYPKNYVRLGRISSRCVGAEETFGWRFVPRGRRRPGAGGTRPEGAFTEGAIELALCTCTTTPEIVWRMK